MGVMQFAGFHVTLGDVSLTTLSMLISPVLRIFSASTDRLIYLPVELSQCRRSTALHPASAVEGTYMIFHETVSRCCVESHRGSASLYDVFFIRSILQVHFTFPNPLFEIT